MHHRTVDSSLAIAIPPMLHILYEFFYRQVYKWILLYLYQKIVGLEALGKYMDIDCICREESFYTSGEEKIKEALRGGKRVRVETGKRIVEGLLREYGSKSLDFLCDFGVDFDIDFKDKGKRKAIFSNSGKNVSLSQQLRDVLGPLIEIKIVGIKIIKFLIEECEQIEKLKNKRNADYLERFFEVERDKKIVKEEKGKDKGKGNGKNHKDPKDIEDSEDSDMEDGGIDVDWDGMYEAAKSTISRLIIEGKIGSKEFEEETKRLREIPKEERIKVIQNRFERIRKIKAASDEEAVRKYICGEKEQKNCLEILEGVRKGKIRIIGDDTYTISKGFFGKRELRIGNYFLSKAAIQAIEANDVPSLKALSKGCFLPSDESVEKTCSLFEYSCWIHADDCALCLLIEGGGIEQKFKNEDRRPLHLASARGNEEICNFLIEKGANIEVEDKIRKTPLIVATIWGNVNVAKLLIERGANIEAKDHFGKTPLHYAAEKNRFEIAKLLIESGANIEVKDKYEWTALHWAVSKNSVEVTKLLIEKGADIEAKNMFSRTVLHRAIVEDNFEVVKILIERGADIEAKDKDGETPLYRAAEYKRVEIAKLLIERGADVKVKNQKGETPLQKTDNYQIKEMIEKAAKRK